MKTLLLVHAHPDDEAIATGGIMARSFDSGHRVVLVTATRGEEGEISNMDVEESRPRLGEIRTEELRRALEIIGTSRQEFLGYRDSGMAGTPSNEHPDSFHQAPLSEAGERLAAILRVERPDVVVTYDPMGTYGHPDHIKAHDVTVAALDILKSEGWEPAKFYEHAIPASGMRIMAERMKEAGRPNPFENSTLVGIPDEEITTNVDVREYSKRKSDAFKAHRSQNSPDSFFLNTPDEMVREIFGMEAYVLRRGKLGGDGRETDIWSGME